MVTYISCKFLQRQIFSSLESERRRIKAWVPTPLSVKRKKVESTNTEIQLGDANGRLVRSS